MVASEGYAITNPCTAPQDANAKFGFATEGCDGDDFSSWRPTVAAALQEAAGAPAGWAWRWAREGGNGVDPPGMARET